MVWGGYAVLMSGKIDSIKLNNNPGCLPGSTFVYSEVFKLDLSSASVPALWSHSLSLTYRIVDTTYWDDPIRRIEYESDSIVVQIDLTWSIGFVLVELDRLLNPLSCSTLLICPICISKVFVDDSLGFLMASICRRSEFLCVYFLIIS
ncbi:hypothetical protein Tco_0969314 [Tanacetum coccineum]